MEMIEGGGNFWKCAITVGVGMAGGARTGFVLGTAFCPGYGTALCTAFGLYLGGVGAGLSSSDCIFTIESINDTCSSSFIFLLLWQEVLTIINAKIKKLNLTSFIFFENSFSNFIFNLFENV